MKNFIIYLIFIITLVSCNRFNNKVIFENNSDKKLDSVLVFGNPLCKPLAFYNVKPNEIEKGKLLNCTQKGNDGSYRIKVYSKDTLIEKVTGYYTNGYPIFSEMTISFDNNKIIRIKEK
jgi:hypothetical protein